VRLTELGLSDFRNLPQVHIDTDAPFVVFHGPNAQGKTNLLEAIYGLATLKSFRTTRVRELIRWGCTHAQVRGTVDDEQLTRHFKLHLDPKGRRGEVDGKAPKALGSYFEGIRAVLFCPQDVAIVREGPEIRRRFIDRAAFTASASFLDVAMGFRRLLSQKGALLRQEVPDPIQLDVFDAQLALAGARLVERRRAVIEELKDPFVTLHQRISGHGDATLRYRTALGAGTREDLVGRYSELLAESRKDEVRRGMNLVGPQRDELVLRIDDRPARAYASQGQTRSVVLALKLAELLAARARGARPLFLLDDLSSELDRFRRGNLVGLLEELEVQVFVTTTDPSLVLSGAQGQVLNYAVKDGAVGGAEHASTH